MKKTLSVLALLGIIVCSAQSANAFGWSNLNPATWFGSGKCGCEKPKCGCKEVKKCDPCSTGYAAPCDPCEKKKIECNPCKKEIQPCAPCQKTRSTCEPCERLQQMNK